MRTAIITKVKEKNGKYYAQCVFNVKGNKTLQPIEDVLILFDSPIAIKPKIGDIVTLLNYDPYVMQPSGSIRGVINSNKDVTQILKNDSDVLTGSLDNNNYFLFEGTEIKHSAGVQKITLSPSESLQIDIGGVSVKINSTSATVINGVSKVTVDKNQVQIDSLKVVIGKVGVLEFLTMAATIQDSLGKPCVISKSGQTKPLAFTD